MTQVQAAYLGTGNAGSGVLRYRGLRLQSRKRLIMHLVAKRQGLMLRLGGDAVVIEMNQ